MTILLDRYGFEQDSADLACDPTPAEAAAGNALLRELERKWTREGFRLYDEGAPIETCWSPQHKQGWLAAQRLAEAFEDSKRWLDVLAVEEAQGGHSDWRGA